MKKLWKLIITAVFVISLSACSSLEEVNEAINYTEAATSHINNLNQFAEEAPALIEAAAASIPAKEELEAKLIELKGQIEEFIALTDIPKIAQDIHQEFIEQNELLLTEINTVLENGHLVLDRIENAEIITTINNAAALLNRIESLGL